MPRFNITFFCVLYWIYWVNDSWIVFNLISSFYANSASNVVPKEDAHIPSMVKWYPTKWNSKNVHISNYVENRKEIQYNSREQSISQHEQNGFKISFYESTEPWENKQCSLYGPFKNFFSYVGLKPPSCKLTVKVDKVFKLASINNRWPSINFRWVPINLRWASIDLRWASINLRWASINLRWASINLRWASISLRWASINLRWAFINLCLYSITCNYNESFLMN